MRRTLPRLAGGAILALAFMAAAGDARADNGVSPVIVQNPVTVANPVTAADIAKAMGVQHPTSVIVGADNINGNITYQVPANQRLIIEFAGGTCFLTNADLNSVALELEQPNSVNFVVLNIPATKANDTTTLNLGEMMRVYADPGTTLRLLPSGGTIGSFGQIACSVNFFGQLIDVP